MRCILAIKPYMYEWSEFLLFTSETDIVSEGTERVSDGRIVVDMTSG